MEDAKQNLDDLDKKLAAFKNQHMGQLPGDEDNNLKILMGLNSQLDANTQTLNRATQDKSYTESMLAQQLAAWKSSQSANNPQTLQTQLSQLQTQLIDLEARYTEDHPDVIKTKADIAQVKKKLAESTNPAKGSETATDKGVGIRAARDSSIAAADSPVSRFDCAGDARSEETSAGDRRVSEPGIGESGH